MGNCSAHRQTAGWRCKGCEQLLCPACVAPKRVQTVDLEVCLLCGELVEPLVRHRAEEKAFAARLPGAFVWPLTKTALITVGAVAITRALLSYFPGIGTLISGALLAAMCFAFIRSTARGSDDLEGLELGDLISDVVMPGVKALVGAAIVWVPAVAWFLLRKDQSLAHPVPWLLLLAGLAYAPMAILVGAGGGSLLDMLNPAFVVRSAQRIGPAYGLAAGVLAALVVPWGVLQWVGFQLNLVPIVFVPRVLDYALSCYVPFVAARILGLLLYTHGDRVGYGMESDYLLPVLKGVAPTGVLREQVVDVGRPKHAPIELDDDAPVAAVQVPEEPRVQRLTELDPDKLPPWKGE